MSTKQEPERPSWQRKNRKVPARLLGRNSHYLVKMRHSGDDTDGHVDDLARFVNPTTVVCAYEEGNDENAEALRKNYEILCQSTDQDGKKLKIVKLPMPETLNVQRRGFPQATQTFT